MLIFVSLVHRVQMHGLGLAARVCDPRTAHLHGIGDADDELVPVAGDGNARILTCVLEGVRLELLLPRHTSGQLELHTKAAAESPGRHSPFEEKVQ